jgi:hypothetical protein
MLDMGDGQRVVAIASGGSSGGMEIWNPADGAVKTLSSTFPPASGHNQTPQMLSILNGKSLIFYENWHHHIDQNKGIYRYSVETNTWIKIGEMLASRDDFVALPVNGLKCN